MSTFFQSCKISGFTTLVMIAILCFLSPVTAQQVSTYGNYPGNDGTQSTSLASPNSGRVKAMGFTMNDTQYLDSLKLRLSS